MRVLLVGAGSDFFTAVTNALRGQGFEVGHVAAKVDRLATSPCDVMLIELDRGDGVRMCREVRARSGVALIGLTTRGREGHGIAALRAGADDYVTRPVRLAELLARIEAVLRRAGPQQYGELPLGRLRIDLDQQRATLDGEPVSLTRKEFRLLVALARNPGSAVTRDLLMAEVWNTSERRGSRTVDSHVNTLRAKIRPAASVECLRGVGYRLRVH